jgi:hypothetical protein
MADHKNRAPAPTNKLSLDLLAPDLDGGAVSARFKEQWQAPMDFTEAKLSPFGEKDDLGDADPQDDILGRRLGSKDRQAVDAPK